MKRSILTLGLCVLTACGGGGGGGGGGGSGSSSSNSTFFGGVYDVKFGAPTQDICGVGGNSTIESVLTVNQDDTIIAVESDGGRHFAGVATAAGFEASNTKIDPTGCDNGRAVSINVTLTYRHDDFVNDSFQLREVSQCDRSVVVCEVIWEGQGTKR